MKAVIHNHILTYVYKYKFKYIYIFFGQALLGSQYGIREIST